MDLKALLIHGGAFTLFTLSSILYSVLFFIYLKTKGTANRENFLIGVIVFNMLKFVSECCISYILWDLGSKKELENFEAENEDEHHFTVRFETFKNENFIM